MKTTIQILEEDIARYEAEEREDKAFVEGIWVGVTSVVVGFLLGALLDKLFF